MNVDWSNLRRLALAAALSLTAAACASQNTAESADREKPTAQSAESEQSDPSASPPADMPDVIERDVLFGNPDRVSIRVSPDGQKLAWLAPHNGVLNIFVGPVDDPDAAEPVTDVSDEPIENFQWTYTSDDILYSQDQDGNEQFHVYRVDLQTNDTKDLTPIDGIQARIEQLSPEHPNKALIGINKRSKKLHDLYEVDLQSGDRRLVQKNTEGFVGFITTDSFDVKLGMKSLPDGGAAYYKPTADSADSDADATEWREVMRLSRDDSMTTSIVGFSDDEETIYMTDSRGRDTAALVAYPFDKDLENNDNRRVLASSERADIDGVTLHPETHKPQAATATYKRKVWKPLDDEFKSHLNTLREATPDGQLAIASRSDDNSIWTALLIQDDGPVRYYTYNTDNQNTDFLFVHREDLKGLPLVEMEPVTVETRDGLTLVNYLSLPPGTETKTDSETVPTEPVPTIIHVHGGPWSRVSWSYHPIHQWLTNRGYAVLSVNFRGSTGFGKNFLNAGNKEWGRKMHNDLLDARQWAIDKGITTADSVGIFGGSYGGYATLVGMTMTPEKFAVGIDVVGPSNLITLLESIPPYWKPMLSMFKTRVGDPATEEGRKLLKERSPINYVDQITNPLLIAQGANDPRVKRAESDQIVRAAMNNNVPVTYALFPDEGHGFSRPHNKMSFYAVAEHFLERHLGGRAQPIDDVFEPSSITIPVGADDLDSVHQALCKPKPDRCPGTLDTNPNSDQSSNDKTEEGNK